MPEPLMPLSEWRNHECDCDCAMCQRGPSWERFTRIHPRVRAAARDLIVAKPWREDPGTQVTRCREFVITASEAYGMTSPPTVVFDSGVRAVLGSYAPGVHRISLPYFSALTLFHEFRHAWQAANDWHGDVEDDARAWSDSLFYAVAPRRFRRMAEAGRLAWVQPGEVPA